MRSIIKNQSKPNITAVATPAPKPSLLVAIGTIIGKINVPAIGVKRMNKRTDIKLSTDNNIITVLLYNDIALRITRAVVRNYRKRKFVSIQDKSHAKVSTRLTPLDRSDADDQINEILIKAEQMSASFFLGTSKLFAEESQSLQRLSSKCNDHVISLARFSTKERLYINRYFATNILSPFKDLFTKGIMKFKRGHCLVVQYSLVEAILFSIYLLYLPLSGPRKYEIMAIIDEKLKNSYSLNSWLRSNIDHEESYVYSCFEEVIPMTLDFVYSLSPQLNLIGINPYDLLLESTTRFNEFLNEVSFPTEKARLLVSNFSMNPKLIELKRMNSEST